MKSKTNINWFLFLAITIAIFFFALDLPLLGPDEPRYAQVGREMFERGDWITPTLGGFNWFEKPALLYWLEIISYHLFGVNEFAARFGSAIFGLGTVISLWFTGKYVQENSNSEIFTNAPKYDFANWLALLGATSLGLIVFSRGASFDIILTFPIAVALTSFYIHLTVRKDSITNRPALAKFYFYAGVALLAKGLIGAIFAFAIVCFFYILRRRIPSRTVLISLFWGIPIMLLVASIWYVPMYLRNGWEFIDIFFIQHHFQRFASNKYLHPQPFWFFWLVLPAMTIPWIFFLFKGIRDFIKDALERKKPNTREKHGELSLYDLQIFGIAWMLVPLVFFSFSGSKLPGYILPALPGAIIFLGVSAYRFQAVNLRKGYWLQFIAAIMFVVVAFLLQFQLPKFAKDDSVKWIVDSANQAGFQKDKIINYKTISHSLEFYGAGRLIRLEDGRQRRFESSTEIREFMKKNSHKLLLILTPNGIIKQEFQAQFSSAKPLGENKEYTLFLITDESE